MHKIKVNGKRGWTKHATYERVPVILGEEGDSATALDGDRPGVPDGGVKLVLQVPLIYIFKAYGPLLATTVGLIIPILLMYQEIRKVLSANVFVAVNIAAASIPNIFYHISFIFIKLIEN